MGKVTRSINSSASAFGRAMVPLALILGHGILITLGGGLVYFGFSLDSKDMFHKLASWVCSAAGTYVLFSLLVNGRIKPCGIRLERAEQPRLFNRINKVAFMAGQAMPDEIYLTDMPRAGIGHSNGIMGLGGTRMIDIGLPLLHGLTVTQFEAVMAHEFGHARYGGLVISGWLQRTRTAIET